MRCLLLSCVFIAALISADPARGAVFRVGTDTACTHVSIQAAIDAAFLTPENDDIRIAGGPYTVPALTILGLTAAQGEIALNGGYATCTSAQPTPGERTKLEAAPGASRILHILGSHRVVLRHLEIGGGAGRGVDFRNGAVPAELVLEGVTVIGNGDGGIQLSNTNFPATAQDQVKLTLRGESSVFYNASAQGGGINCLNATLVVQGRSEVSANYATDHGGGIYADGCQVTVLSASLAGNVSITRGGALYLTGANARANFWIEHPDTASKVLNNRAQRGGGIALANDARMEMVDAVVANNTALVEGGAFWLAPGADAGAGTRLELRGATSSDVGCLRAEDCNVVSNNQAWNSEELAPESRAKPGSLIAFGAAPSGRARAVFGGARIQGNRGVTLSQQAERSELTFNGSLIVGNEAEAQLFEAFITDGGLRVAASTIADNRFPIPGRPVFLALTNCAGSSGLRVERSIVWQPTEQAFPGTLGPLDPACYRHLIASNFPGLPASSERISDDPQFRDPAAGDYRLAETSPGVDFAPPWAFDLTRDGNPRNVDRPAVNDRFGPQDLGAYEQSVEYLVKARVASGLGTVSPETQPVAQGTRALLTLVPDPGWKAVSPLDGTCAPGNRVDDTTWRTGIVTADCRVDARFKYQSRFVGFEASPNPGVWGQNVTFTATLDAYQPSSIVAFYLGTELLGTAAPDSAGVARLSVSTLAPGTYTITARYPQDANNLEPLAITTRHTVVNAATTTVIDPLAIRYGEPAIVSAQVTALDSGAGKPTGTIQISSPASPQSCTIFLPETSCVLSTSDRIGQFDLSAQYSGDGHFSGSNRQSTLTITPQFVGGSIAGLDANGFSIGLEVEGSLLRSMNLASGSTGFVFDDRPIPVGASYALIVISQPPGRTCRIDQGSGTMPPADVGNVTVTCTRNTYAVTLNAGTGGSLSIVDPPGVDPASVPHGSVLTIAATPESGYHLAEMTGCSGAIASGSLTTAPVTAPCTVTAVFAVAGAPRVHEQVSIDNGRTASLPGDAVTYQVVVQNHSAIAVDGMTLQSTLPAALTAARWQCDAASAAFCSPASGTGDVVTTINLPPSSSARVSLSGVLGEFQTSVAVTVDLTVPASYEDISYLDNRATDVDQRNTTPIFSSGFEDP